MNIEFCLHYKHLQTLKSVAEPSQVKITVKYQEAYRHLLLQFLYSL